MATDLVPIPEGGNRINVGQVAFWSHPGGYLAFRWAMHPHALARGSRLTFVPTYVREAVERRRWRYATTLPDTNPEAERRLPKRPPPDPHHPIFVGVNHGFGPRMNNDGVLIRAFATMRDRYPGACLHATGEGFEPGGPDAKSARFRHTDASTRRPPHTTAFVTALSVQRSLVLTGSITSSAVIALIAAIGVDAWRLRSCSWVTRESGSIGDCNITAAEGRTQNIHGCTKSAQIRMMGQEEVTDARRC